MSRKSKPLNVGPLLEMLESLPYVPPIGEEYTEVDRARDFISVFSGNSDGDQGRRVMAQIAAICDPTMTREDADKPGTLAYHAGMREVMRQIQRCFTARGPIVVEKEVFEDGDASE